MPRGGHSAPAEEPELLARDIAAFFATGAPAPSQPRWAVVPVWSIGLAPRWLQGPSPPRSIVLRAPPCRTRPN
jgi:hypothetical protein